MASKKNRKYDDQGREIVPMGEIPSGSLAGVSPGSKVASRFMQSAQKKVGYVANLMTNANPLVKGVQAAGTGIINAASAAGNIARKAMATGYTPQAAQQPVQAPQQAVQQPSNSRKIRFVDSDGNVYEQEVSVDGGPSSQIMRNGQPARQQQIAPGMNERTAILEHRVGGPVGPNGGTARVVDYNGNQLVVTGDAMDAMKDDDTMRQQFKTAASMIRNGGRVPKPRTYQDAVRSGNYSEGAMQRPQPGPYANSGVGGIAPLVFTGNADWDRKVQSYKDRAALVNQAGQEGNLSIDPSVQGIEQPVTVGFTAGGMQAGNGMYNRSIAESVMGKAMPETVANPDQTSAGVNKIGNWDAQPEDNARPGWQSAEQWYGPGGGEAGKTPSSRLGVIVRKPQQAAEPRDQDKVNGVRMTASESAAWRQEMEGNNQKKAAASQNAQTALRSANALANRIKALRSVDPNSDPAVAKARSAIDVAQGDVVRARIGSTIPANTPPTERAKAIAKAEQEAVTKLEQARTAYKASLDKYLTGLVPQEMIDSYKKALDESYAAQEAVDQIVQEGRDITNRHTDAAKAAEAAEMLKASLASEPTGAQRKPRSSSQARLVFRNGQYQREAPEKPADLAADEQMIQSAMKYGTKAQRSELAKKLMAKYGDGDAPAGLSELAARAGLEGDKDKDESAPKPIITDSALMDEATKQVEGGKYETDPETGAQVQQYPGIVPFATGGGDIEQSGDRIDATMKDRYEKFQQFAKSAGMSEERARQAFETAITKTGDSALKESWSRVNQQQAKPEPQPPTEEEVGQVVEREGGEKAWRTVVSKLGDDGKRLDALPLYKDRAGNMLTVGMGIRYLLNVGDKATREQKQKFFHQMMSRLDGDFRDSTVQALKAFARANGWAD